MGYPTPRQNQNNSLLEIRQDRPFRVNVLIADDSMMVCSRLRDLLSAIRGVAVSGEAHSANEALDFIQENSPDIVILDIQMPGGSGFPVLQRTKTDLPGTIVIILTNYPYPQYKKKYLEAGADYFFDKSTEFEKLVDLIRQLSDGQLSQHKN